jgi:uncharacterized SAM-binding protein YcdF (DUF218 family)
MTAEWGTTRTILRVTAGFVALLAVAGAAVGAAVLWPTTDNPQRVDAVVVLSGDHGERLARAKELLAAGVAPILVLVGEPDSAENLDMCAGRTAFTVVCLRPEPDSTRSEAASVAELARSRNWRTLAVVTSTPHVTRARILFDRCFSGSLQMVGADLPYGGDAARRGMIHEWFGLVYALGSWGC